LYSVIWPKNENKRRFDNSKILPFFHLWFGLWSNICTLFLFFSALKNDLQWTKLIFISINSTSTAYLKTLRFVEWQRGGTEFLATQITQDKSLLAGRPDGRRHPLLGLVLFVCLAFHVFSLVFLVGFSQRQCCCVVWPVQRWRRGRWFHSDLEIPD